MEGVVRWLVGYMISALETVSSFCEFTISGSFGGGTFFYGKHGDEARRLTKDYSVHEPALYSIAT